MFDYLINRLAIENECFSWEELEPYYYDFMEHYELDDNDIEGLTKEEINKLIKDFK